MARAITCWAALELAGKKQLAREGLCVPLTTSLPRDSPQELFSLEGFFFPPPSKELSQLETNHFRVNYKMKRVGDDV